MFVFTDEVNRLQKIRQELCEKGRHLPSQTCFPFPFVGPNHTLMHSSVRWCCLTPKLPTLNDKSTEFPRAGDVVANLKEKRKEKMIKEQRGKEKYSCLFHMEMSEVTEAVVG
ncbi:hypothetical protein TRVL_05008 [Trypanosoma vivax]|nr:hypothetical protein TRVL_05008 [Trypanosoma vivax]